MNSSWGNLGLSLEFVMELAPGRVGLEFELRLRRVAVWKEVRVGES